MQSPMACRYRRPYQSIVRAATCLRKLRGYDRPAFDHNVHRAVLALFDVSLGLVHDFAEVVPTESSVPKLR